MTIDLEELDTRINRATSKLVFITGEGIPQKKTPFRRLAKKENYSYILFKELLTALTTIDGKIAQFPSIKDQLIALTTGFIIDEKSTGVIIDKFDFDIIKEVHLQLRIYHEFKSYLKDPTTKGKLVLINYGKPLRDMFEAEFIRKCSIIRI
jgi:hypothetical protein